MKKWRKRLSIFLVLVFAVSTMAGCGGEKLKADEATEAWLKAELKGEFDDYANLLGISTEEVKSEYDKSVEELKDMFEETGAFDESNSQDVVPLVEEILASAKYEVGTYTEDEDGGYTVNVQVYPSNVMELYLENMMTAAIEAPVDDVAAAVLLALRDALDGQEYGEAITCQVRIDYDKDAKEYSFNEEDSEELVNKLFTIDENSMAYMKPSGKTYENPYFNWGPEEWSAASDDEKVQCTLAIVQVVNGFSDEDMAYIDSSDANVQSVLQELIDEIDLIYDNDATLTVGDYVSYVQNMGI